MIKLSDYVFRYLVKQYHVSHCFMVTGGGAMHLNDSIGHTDGLKYICNHHEQACAIAAEGYYRASGKLPVVCVTTGPGGTNTLTGVLGQWLDSIPALYISGQVKQSTTLAACPELNLRQLGDQEADIKSMVRPITKYCVTISDPCSIRYEIDKAISIALDGRPGPVWIDIPLDVQATFIDEDALVAYASNKSIDSVSILHKDVRMIYDIISKAKAPLFYIGNGIRLANRVKEFVELMNKTGIPGVTSISGSDIIGYENPLFFGKPGICGDRLGNVMVQNADVLIIIGTRLSIRQIGYAYEKFAPNAYKIMIDVDEAEMDKPTLKVDKKICANIADFIDASLDIISTYNFPSFKDWISFGNRAKNILPSLIDDNPDVPGYTNSYRFVEELFNELSSGDVVVTGNGTAYTCTYQAMNVKNGVRVFANQGCASMGYGLPASIGACVSGLEGRIICITGDGSLQMNIQELQTVVTYGLPLKIFVLENEGYLAIKTTQNSFFNGNFTGSNPTSGVKCPNLHRLADAYGIAYLSCSENGDKLKKTILDTLNFCGPIICEVHMAPEQSLFPKAASYVDENTGKLTSAPLDNMAPFVSDSILRNLIFRSEKNV